MVKERSPGAKAEIHNLEARAFAHGYREQLGNLLERRNRVEGGHRQGLIFAKGTRAKARTRIDSYRAGNTNPPEPPILSGLEHVQQMEGVVSHEFTSANKACPGQMHDAGDLVFLREFKNGR